MVCWRRVRPVPPGPAPARPRRTPGRSRRTPVHPRRDQAPHNRGRNIGVCGILILPAVCHSSSAATDRLAPQRSSSGEHGTGCRTLTGCGTSGAVPLQLRPVKARPAAWGAARSVKACVTGPGHHTPNLASGRLSRVQHGVVPRWMSTRLATGWAAQRWQAAGHSMGWRLVPAWAPRMP